MPAPEDYSAVAPAPPPCDRFALPIKGDVTYSCGSCGYLLNLNSCNRNTSTIGSKYGKAIKKGLISFYAVDESRFSLDDDISCKPYFISKLYWGLFQRRTKLLCRKCGKHIGNAYNQTASPNGSHNIGYIPGDGANTKKYSIKISTLQPSDSGAVGIVTKYLRCIDF